MKKIIVELTKEQHDYILCALGIATMSATLAGEKDPEFKNLIAHGMYEITKELMMYPGNVADSVCQLFTGSDPQAIELSRDEVKAKVKELLNEKRTTCKSDL